MTDLALFLAVMVGLPTALMVPIRRAGRAAFFALGLVFAFGIGTVMQLGGPDSPALVIPMFGLAVSVSAVLAEAVRMACTLVAGKCAHG